MKPVTLYRDIFESIPAPMWIHDLTTLAIIDANEAAAKTCGYSREEFIQLSVKSIDSGHVHSSDQLSKHLETIRDNTAPASWEGRIQHKSGSHMWVKLCTKQIHYDGQDWGLSLLTDVGTVPRLDERIIPLFIHDLRTPLTVIKLIAGHLQTLPQAAGSLVQGLAGQIVNHADRAERLVRDLLDYNQLRLPRSLPIHPVAMDLGPLAKHTVEELASIHRANINLVCTGDLNGVWCPDGIRRVLENIITNAVKYGTPDGPITVTLTREPSRTVLRVHNTGPPIPVYSRDQLFDPYFQMGAQSALPSGWGLGLAIVRDIVESHRGSIEVQSSHVGGTTFQVKLPIRIT